MHKNYSFAEEKQICVSIYMYPYANAKQKYELKVKKKPMMIRVEIDDWGPLTVIETMPVADLAIGMCTRFGTLSTSTIFINS